MNMRKQHQDDPAAKTDINVFFIIIFYSLGLINTNKKALFHLRTGSILNYQLAMSLQFIWFYNAPKILSPTDRRDTSDICRCVRWECLAKPQAGVQNVWVAWFQDDNFSTNRCEALCKMNVPPSCRFVGDYIIQPVSTLLYSLVNKTANMPLHFCEIHWFSKRMEVNNAFNIPRNKEAKCNNQRCTL